MGGIVRLFYYNPLKMNHNFNINFKIIYLSLEITFFSLMTFNFDF